MIDPLYEDVYNEKILNELTQRFGPLYHHHAELTVSTWAMLEMMRKMKRKSRRGEVVMVVPNEQGQVWLHAKAFYPAGVYRLLTGGVEPGETPDQALLREVEEETGFQTKIDRCLAVITYLCSGDGITLPFVSYAFLTAPTSGWPQPTNPGEAITGFQAVSVETLTETALKLRSLKDIFTDWGIFRAIAHEIVKLQMTTQPTPQTSK